jgi:hypothetical protein
LVQPGLMMPLKCSIPWINTLLFFVFKVAWSGFLSTVREKGSDQHHGWEYYTLPAHNYYKTSISHLSLPWSKKQAKERAQWQCLPHRFVRTTWNCVTQLPFWRHSKWTHKYKQALTSSCIGRQVERRNSETFWIFSLLDEPIKLCIISNSKQNGRGGEFKYDIWYIARTFVNATMYAYPAQQLKKKKPKINQTNRKTNFKQTHNPEY